MLSILSDGRELTVFVILNRKNLLKKNCIGELHLNAFREGG
jgi:hypothetical protein